MVAIIAVVTMVAILAKVAIIAKVAILDFGWGFRRFVSGFREFRRIFGRCREGFRRVSGSKIVDYQKNL